MEFKTDQSEELGIWEHFFDDSWGQNFIFHLKFLLEL